MKAYSAISDFSDSAQKMLIDAGIELVLNTGERPNENELQKIVQEYDILIIGAREKMTKDVYKVANRLKIIGSLSVGLDHIDDVFKKSDTITVVNTPNANIVSVAEHTIGLILAHYKKLPDSRISVLEQTGRNGLNGRPRDLFGKTIGIIGAGNIASKVMDFANAFGMKILCYTFHPEEHTDLLAKNASFVSINELLTKSDIVTIHIASSDKTHNLISADELELMKEKSVLINTSRYEICDMDAILKRVTKIPTFCVGLDVDIDSKHPLFNSEYRNVIVTPHTAGISLDAILRMDPELSANILSVLNK